MNFANIEFPIIELEALGELVLLEDTNTSFNCAYERKNITDDLD